MDPNLKAILQQLEAEKSIDRATLIEAIRSAIESAARKSMAESGDIAVDVDPDTLAFKVFDIKTVATPAKANDTMKQRKEKNRKKTQ